MSAAATMTMPAAQASTSLASPAHYLLARFEFEAGCSNEGSKILMVEWDANIQLSKASTSQDDWLIEWDGKVTTSAVMEHDSAEDVSRTYFLIPSNISVPSELTVRHRTTGQTFTTKCMPAIFASGLGGPAETVEGKRGVLHTRWAQNRLIQLQGEVDTELKDNPESVGVEMAVQEQLWIMEHFGVPAPAGSAASDALAAQEQARKDAEASKSSPSRSTARSPVNSRLSDKLKGLKLGTSAADLSRPSYTPQPSALRPVVPDSAASSTQASSAAGTIASLDGVLTSSTTVPTPASVNPAMKDGEDELFALPMSPRSPEMKTSPFSFLT